MKSLQIDNDIVRYLASRAVEPDEPLSDVLRRELSRQTIEIDDDTYDYLLSKAVTVGESASDIIRRVLNLSNNEHQASTVIFRILAGTGSQPWNTRGTEVIAHVGDTLRIINDDSVAHRPHTDGAPFPHANDDIQPGSSADYFLGSRYDPATDPPIYDHNFGTGASFWIIVQP